MNILLTVGISGAGKSTWVEEFLKVNPDYLCVNRDLLRTAVIRNLKNYYQRQDLNHIEELVNSLTSTILQFADQNKYNVIVDNTNLTKKYINWFINYPGILPITWQYRLFNIAPSIAKTRVLRRDFAEEVLHGKIENVPMNKVAYIDKQYAQFSEIKKYLLDNHLENQTI